LGELEKLGAIVTVTGDHGMSDKSHDDGTPNVLFVEDYIRSQWPETKPRVICPIADPFVKHHGAMGGFVRVHLLGERKTDIDGMLEQIRKLPQVEVAMTGEEAAALFEMPLDREGDMVVIAKQSAALGARADEHDLSQLGGHRLRSHGGLSEQGVPLIRSAVVKDADCLGKDRQWRNFDAFDLALNY